MTVLGPPTVIGPVLTTSTSVRVDGVVKLALVQVVAADDDTEHASGTAYSTGTVWLPVTVPLREGSSLLARQQGQNPKGPPSVRSAQGVPVLTPPKSLPAPMFQALLNQCSYSALLTGLVPGAEVTIERAGGIVLATQKVKHTHEWIQLDGAPLSVGETLTAWQGFPGADRSPAGSSDPVTRVDRHVAIPRVVEATACHSEIIFAGLVPTALVTADFDDGSSLSWRASNSMFSGTLDDPLVAGGLRVRQLLPRCGLQSEDGLASVGPAQTPPTPNTGPFCPETRKIAVDGLLKGAEVTFSTISYEPSGPVSPEEPLMTLGAKGGLQDFDLPPHVGGAPGPLTGLRVRQTLCGLTSDFAQASEYARPGTPGLTQSPHPQIVRPVYCGAQTVRLDPPGWGYGVLRSVKTGRQLADAFVPLAGRRQVLDLYFPLEAGDLIAAEYVGCSPPTPTDQVKVDEVPTPIPDLYIVPPLPGDTDLVTSGALPGAWVVAKVAHLARSAQISIDGSATLPLGPPLAEGDLVWAYQRLCGAHGNDDNSIKVTRGTLTVSATPTTVTAGTAATITVTATRTDTGAAVDGLPVTIGGANVGFTGTAFTWQITASGALPGIVKGGPRFTDAGFTLTVTAAPSRPAGGGTPPGVTLTLQLGGNTTYPVSISKMTWRVQPSWVTGPVSASGTTATVNLPPPPAGTPNPRASIYLDEFQATRTQDGTLYKLWPDALAPMTNVALTKSAFHVGFLLTNEVRHVPDEFGNPVEYVWMGLIRWMGTA